MYNTHTLANGATIVMTSPHGCKFSDGSEAAGNPELAKVLTLVKTGVKRGEVRGMALNQVVWTISDQQYRLLTELSTVADLVLVPFPFLSALRESGRRDNFPNVVAANATRETERSAPNDKVWDINNWSY